VPVINKKKIMLFAKNVGGTDRIIRVALGIAIIGAGTYYGSLWGLLGAVVLATGVFSRCGLYTLVGVSTCKVNPAVSGEGNSDSPSRE
jgi:hypothetical protein